MNTFNMKQWLVENKVGPYSKIHGEGLSTDGADNFELPDESPFDIQKKDRANIEWDWRNADYDVDVDEDGNGGAFGTVQGRDDLDNLYSARFDTPVDSYGDMDFDQANLFDVEHEEDPEGNAVNEPVDEQMGVGYVMKTKPSNPKY